MSDSIIRDTGPLERVGRLARERLELAFPPTLFQHAWMPSRLTPQVWSELLRRTPFIGLGWAKLGPKPGTPANQFLGNSAWSVFLVVKNPGGQEARLFGDRQGPGLFKMVRATVAVLHGAKVPEVGTIQIVDSGNGFMEGYEKEDLAVAAVDFECPLSLTVRNTLDVRPADLEELDITWSFAGSTDDPQVDTNTMGTS